MKLCNTQNILYLYQKSSILYLAVGKQLIDSESAHDNEGNINFGADIEEICVILGNHLEFLHNLRNLEGRVLNVAHHEVVLLGDDIPRYVDIGRDSLRGNILQHQWWLKTKF